MTSLSFLFVEINTNIAQLFKTHITESKKYSGVTIDLDTVSAYDALLLIKEKPAGIVVLRYKEREEPSEKSFFEKTFR